jgi:hypothetical protein
VGKDQKVAKNRQSLRAAAVALLYVALEREFALAYLQGKNSCLSPHPITRRQRSLGWGAAGHSAVSIWDAEFCCSSRARPERPERRPDYLIPDYFPPTVSPKLRKLIRPPVEKIILILACTLSRELHYNTRPIFVTSAPHNSVICIHYTQI